MDILSLVLSSALTTVTGIVNIIVGVFTGLTSVWIDTSGDNPALTLVGAFSLIGFVMGMTIFGLKFVGSLISLRTAR